MGVIKQGTGLAASTFKNTSSEDVFSICPWPCFHIQSLASFYPQPAPLVLTLTLPSHTFFQHSHIFAITLVCTYTFSNSHIHINAPSYAYIFADIPAHSQTHSLESQTPAIPHRS